MARDMQELTHVLLGDSLPLATTASILDALDRHVSEAPERTAMVFPATRTTMSWRELWQRSLEAAASLHDAGVRPGDLVGVLLRNDDRFVPALLAIWHLGAVAAPMPIPGAFADVDAYAEHIRGMIEAAEIRHVVHDPSLPSRHTETAVRITPSITWIDGAARVGEEVPRGAIVRPVPSDLALVSYTSGSTSVPKGVELTHANITAAMSAFGIATEFGPGDAWGIWTPLFHDFALVSMLTALSYGASVWVWPPTRFIRDPGAWLAEFGRAGITHYSGPNFSFDLMCDSATDEVMAGVSLAAWRVAVSGGEPVSAATVSRFSDRFEAYGLRAETMVPGYGLAEATLAVTVTVRVPGTSPRVLTVSREGLTERRRAEPVDGDGPGVRALVSLGPPIPGMAIRSVDELGTVLPERCVGEIEVASPSITRGYRGHPDIAPDGWLATGDLGFVDDGELFIAGRIKDIVNVRGTKYHPEDLEPVVAAVEGVHRGRCCVVGEGETDERMAVIAETRMRRNQLSSLRREIQERLMRRLGIGDIHVYLVEPRTVQVTSNGKVRRQLMRARLEGGLLYDLEDASLEEQAPVA